MAEVIVIDLDAIRETWDKLYSRRGERVYLIFGKIDFRLGHTCICYRFNEQTRTSQIILVIDREPFLVCGEHNILRSIPERYVSVSWHPSLDKDMYLKIGIPLTLVSLNALYHTGNKAYLNLNTSLMILL
jgi:hypothetical protein